MHFVFHTGHKVLRDGQPFGNGLGAVSRAILDSAQDSRKKVEMGTFIPIWVLACSLNVPLFHKIYALQKCIFFSGALGIAPRKPEISGYNKILRCNKIRHLKKQQYQFLYSHI